MRRQIIKTRPVRPYRAARIVILVVLVAAALVLGYVLFAPHARALQDLGFAPMNAPNPIILS